MHIRSIMFVLLMMGCAVLATGELYLTIPLGADIARQHHVDASSSGLAGSFFGFAYAAGFLAFGPLSDRVGRARVLLFGLLAAGAATALAGIAPSFAFFLSARALQGASAAAVAVGALALVPEALLPHHRPLGVSAMSLAFLGSAPIAQLVGARLAGGGISTVMLVVAPAYVIVAGGILLLNAHPKSHHSRHGSGANNPSSASLFQDRSIVAAWAASATVLFAFVLFQVGMQIAGSDLPVDIQELRYFTFPPLLLTIAAVPLVKRVGVSMTARIGLLLIATGLLVAAIASRMAFISGLVILTSGVALAIPGLIGLVSSRADNHNRGFAIAIYSFALFSGASLGPLAAQTLMREGITSLCLLPAFLALLAFVIVQRFAIEN